MLLMQARWSQCYCQQYLGSECFESATERQGDPFTKAVQDGTNRPVTNTDD